MSSARERRALLRRTWSGGLTRVHEPAQLASPGERLASMWQLACDAWSLTGKPMPQYDRGSMPGVLIRKA